MSDPDNSAAPYHHIIPAVLLAAVDHDLRYFHKLSNTFLRTAPALLASLQAAIESGDQSRIARASHALKSSTMLLGANALSAELQAIEDGTLQLETLPLLLVQKKLTQLLAAVMQEVRHSIAHFQST